jgi:hypothetical protein
VGWEVLFLQVLCFAAPASSQQSEYHDLVDEPFWICLGELEEAD